MDPGTPSGPTLLQTFSHAQRPEESVLLRILASLLEALQTLHQTGIIHGNLGPDAVHLDATGRGILAVHPGNSPVLTVTGNRVPLHVTPGYSPLEAYQVGPGLLSPASDIYSFGAIAFWLMTGQHPDEAPSRALVDKLPVLSGRPNLAHYSVELREAVDTCLWLLPVDRPQQVAPLTTAMALLQTRLAAREAAPACAIFVPDPQRLAAIRAALGTHLLPPVVSAMLAQAQRKAGNWKDYCDELARHIDEPALRENFLARFSSNPEATSGDPAAASADANRFSPDLLAALETELKQNLGAVARIVVRRAAGKAVDKTSLFQAISAEIENPILAQKFLAWAKATLGS